MICAVHRWEDLRLGCFQKRLQWKMARILEHFYSHCTIEFNGWNFKFSYIVHGIVSTVIEKCSGCYGAFEWFKRFMFYRNGPRFSNKHCCCFVILICSTFVEFHTFCLVILEMFGWNRTMSARDLYSNISKWLYSKALRPNEHIAHHYQNYQAKVLFTIEKSIKATMTITKTFYWCTSSSITFGAQPCFFTQQMLEIKIALKLFFNGQLWCPSQTKPKTDMN